MHISLFAKRLKELRLSHKMILHQIANMLNISHVSYLRWEQGKTQPSIESITQLCKIFDVSSDYLFGIGDAYI